MNKEKLILVGRISGVHGIKGEIKILPYGNCEKKPWKKLYLFRGGQSIVVCEVIHNRPHKGLILASIKDCNDRNCAGELVGCDVLIERTSLALLPEGEYYQFQLEGMEVITEKGKTLGVITSIFSTGSNDIYVVKTGGTPPASKGEEILIPAISDVVLKVDIVKKKMVVRMPEGLLSEPAKGSDE